MPHNDPDRYAPGASGRRGPLPSRNTGQIQIQFSDAVDRKPIPSARVVNQLVCCWSRVASRQAVLGEGYRAPGTVSPSQASCRHRIADRIDDRVTDRAQKKLLPAPSALLDPRLRRPVRADHDHQMVHGCEAKWIMVQGWQGRRSRSEMKIRQNGPKVWRREYEGIIVGRHWQFRRPSVLAPHWSHRPRHAKRPDAAVRRCETRCAFTSSRPNTLSNCAP